MVSSIAATTTASSSASSSSSSVQMPREAPRFPRAAGQSFPTTAGTCRIITVHEFLEQAAPHLRYNLDIDRIIRRLRTSPRKPSPQKAITKRGRWKGFAKNPAETSRAEREAFKYLGVAVGELVKASKLKGKDVQPFLHFENNANCDPTCPYRDGSDTLPDAYLYHGLSPSWRSIAVCGEHQKYDGMGDVVHVVHVRTSPAPCPWPSPNFMAE